jgi:hypothetical protein
VAAQTAGALSRPLRIVYAHGASAVAMPLPPINVAVPGRSVLTVDGTVCGFVISAEGGDISAPVIREPDGAFVRKRLGAPAPEPIVLSFDLSLEKVVYEWIAEFWKGSASEREGSVISVDRNGKATSELVFERAVIAATTVPAMDAAAKTPCSLTVKLDPAATVRRRASGSVDVVPKPRKPWLPANFRLEVAGVDAAFVTRIEPLAVVGGAEGTVDFPDLRVVISEARAETWSAWHREFVVLGRNDDAREKSGLLNFLAQDLKSVLGRVTLHGLGIHRLASAPVPELGAAEIRRLVAEVYCERMELAVP